MKNQYAFYKYLLKNGFIDMGTRFRVKSFYKPIGKTTSLIVEVYLTENSYYMTYSFKGMIGKPYLFSLDVNSFRLAYKHQLNEAMLLATSHKMESV